MSSSPSGGSAAGKSKISLAEQLDRRKETFKLSADHEKQCQALFKRYDHLQLDLLDRGAFREAFAELCAESNAAGADSGRPPGSPGSADEDGFAKTVFDTCSGDQNYLTLKEFQQVFCLVKRQEILDEVLPTKRAGSKPKK
ncbi:unnamed protein product [Amoebophrya sp. A120]|nr:unnamed protein product [Amoebophrya sp. A120]|eukprot:GSA120T00020293001.1